MQSPGKGCQPEGMQSPGDLDGLDIFAVLAINVATTGVTSFVFTVVCITLVFKSFLFYSYGGYGLQHYKTL